MLITIDSNILFCAIIFSILIIIIVIIITREIRYYTKRKFDAIEEYNRLMAEKLNTYQQNQSQFFKNMEYMGISSNKIRKIFLKVIESINKFIGSK